METSLASLCNLFSLTRYICFHFSSHSFEAAKSVNSSFSSRFAIFWILLKEGARHDGRFHMCIFRTICTKFYWLHDTFHNNTFCSFSGKAHSVFGSFHCLSKYLKWLFFLLEYVRLILGSPFQDAHLHIPKWWLFHLDLNTFFPVQQITDASRVKWLLMYVCKIKNFIIFTFEETQNFKRFECKYSKLLGNRHCEICVQIK